MKDRTSVKRRLRENPQFASWLKKRPELYRKVKRDPSDLEGLIVSWKKEQSKQMQFQKISQGYRQVASHIQELQSLMEQVEGLMSNVKQLNEDLDRYKERIKLNEKKKRNKG